MEDKIAKRAYGFKPNLNIKNLGIYSKVDTREVVVLLETLGIVWEEPVDKQLLNEILDYEKDSKIF